ncbi:MAG: L,D-transpeptidase family protein [Tepidisphaerales bacterium]
MAKAVTGIALVAGASAVIVWWNTGGRFAAGTPDTAHADTPVRPVTPPRTTETPAPAGLTPPASSSPAPPSAPTQTTPTLTTPTTDAAASASAAETAPATVPPASPVAPGLAGSRPPGVALPPDAPAVQLTAPRPITESSPAALREGQALQAAGRLVEARERVNRALLLGEFADDADAAAARQLLQQINQVLVFSPQRIAGDPWVDSVTIRPGDRLTRIANEYAVPYELLLRINNIPDARRVRAGQTLKVIRGPIHAVVDKRRFTMDLFFGSPGGEDSVYITTFRVGLGSNDSTPTGLWRVTPENKLRNPTYYSPRGEGIIHADDPMNPLGEFWIGLTGVEGDAVGRLSYGIHGTIEPESIGRMASLGCIRLLNEDVERVFEMLFEGRSLVRVIE